MKIYGSFHKKKDLSKCADAHAVKPDIYCHFFQKLMADGLYLKEWWTEKGKDMYLTDTWQSTEDNGTEGEVLQIIWAEVPGMVPQK